MGNKKKQTNEFDNYFDDDFEVVYEDPEDLGSYLSCLLYTSDAADE